MGEIGSLTSWKHIFVECLLEVLHAFHVHAFLVLVVGEYNGGYKVIPWLHLDHDGLALFSQWRGLLKEEWPKADIQESRFNTNTWVPV